jgi:AAA+ superfamily predicted ATPase
MLDDAHGIHGIRLRSIERSRLWLAHSAEDFADDARVFEAGRILFALGEAANGCKSRRELLEVEELLEQIRNRLHDRLSASGSAVQFSMQCRDHELTSLETEILLLLTLCAFGLLEAAGGVSDLDDVQRRMRPCGIDPLEIVRALRPGSKLVTSGLVRVTEIDLPVTAQVAISEDLLQDFWHEKKQSAWTFGQQEDAHDQLRRVVLGARRHIKRAEDDEFTSLGSEYADRLPQHLNWLYFGFRSGVRQHPDWPLAKILGRLSERDGVLLLILMGKELGHLSPEHRLFRGFGLASSVSSGPAGLRSALMRLRKDSALRTQGIIRPCGGIPPGVVVEDDAILREAEFEISSRFRNELGIKRQWRSRSGNLRQANTKLSQLVLHENVQEAIHQVVVHARRPERLLDDWGLREVMPYGHGTTLLFTGPPGVGKTAAAEAIADELGRPLLTIDYSAIQSCWLGETEKNVVRAFREAADEDALLFWDEADAVFFDRNSASRNWEVTEVNVLLKEVEVFSGVCILATNRDLVLDPALERRISRRIRFEPPTAEMGSNIWRLMMPKAMPLVEPPDFEQLGQLGLTGGQIKNAVLNAARAALHRGSEGGVCHEDLYRAANREMNRLPRTEMGFKVNRRTSFQS